MSYWNKETRQLYYDRNRDYLLTYQKQYYREHRDERLLYQRDYEYNKKRCYLYYFPTHYPIWKKQISEYNKRHYLKNRDRILKRRSK
jgi:hypothetical protein